MSKVSDRLKSAKVLTGTEGACAMPPYHVPITEEELRLQWKRIMTPGEKEYYLRVREANLSRQKEEGDAALYAFMKVLDLRRESVP